MSHVAVHADGGDCHGVRLIQGGRCAGCGLIPDAQSVELWSTSDARWPYAYGGQLEHLQYEAQQLRLTVDALRNQRESLLAGAELASAEIALLNRVLDEVGVESFSAISERIYWLIGSRRVARMERDDAYAERDRAREFGHSLAVERDGLRKERARLHKECDAYKARLARVTEVATGKGGV